MSESRRERRERIRAYGLSPRVVAQIKDWVENHDFDSAPCLSIDDKTWGNVHYWAERLKEMGISFKYPSQEQLSMKTSQRIKIQKQ